MKKRLRKKLNRGEFEVFCFPLGFRFPEGLNSDQDQHLDSFIAEAIEANLLQFGGGGADAEGRRRGMVEGMKKDVSEEKARKALEEWLQGTSWIEEYYLGPCVGDEDEWPWENAPGKWQESFRLEEF